MSPPKPGLKLQWTDRNSGSVHRDGWTAFEFVLQDGKFQLFSHVDADPSEFARAGKLIAKERPEVEIVVRTLKPPAAILADCEDNQIVERLRRVLVLALQEIGTTEHEIELLAPFGIGSEFRAYLVQVGTFALKFLAATILLQGNAYSTKFESIAKRVNLADEILKITCAVAFTMRDDIRPAWDLTMAISVRSLEQMLRDLEPLSAAN